MASETLGCLKASVCRASLKGFGVGAEVTLGVTESASER